MNVKKLAVALLLPTLVTGMLSTGQAPAVAASEDAVIIQSVNFRDKPSTSGERIRYLKSGESVDILSKSNSYWYRVKDHNGVIGYVSTQSKYIKLLHSGSSTADKPISVTGSAVKVIAAGKKYMGTPYQFGSNRKTTTTFDCSDFVRQAFKDGAGLILPGNSRTQAAYVKNIGITSAVWRNLKPGDIMFFMSYKGTHASDYAGIDKSKQRITHNGIYLGGGKVLHTYSEKSGGVRIDSIEGRHWEYRFVFGGNALK